MIEQREHTAAKRLGLGLINADGRSRAALHEVVNRSRRCLDSRVHDLHR